ncbi:Het-C-domain-containing protein [Atractiella rhizophila]|nr:Het-C-domain-containing protein [Atractiella rhizophila]
MVLGFLAHGYATGEFEVTEERLGVYLPVEHIDNPKDYNSNKDARTVHPQLRPPVEPRELEIDPRTGMKNYIANETGGWDTSSALIRRVLEKCIETGRRYRASKNIADEYESYRLLGTALHTLEDLAAHSNWCEISLVRLGYRKVFCHVGDAVIIQTPNGPAPPLVTGTFGSDDFIHSLLGEAGDKLSEASVSDLNKAIDNAHNTTDRGGGGDTLRNLIFSLPGGIGNDPELSRGMAECEGIRSRAANIDPSQMSPQDLHATLWKVLTFRDNVVKSIENTIEKIPGLSTLVGKITDSINKFVFVTLEPYLKPLLSSATGALQTGSAEILNNSDQFQVFDNPQASDPTHSFLSKDHFNLILNEPAGNLAKIIVNHTVNLVVKAWEKSDVNVRQTIDTILEALHHPYFLNERSAVQKEMGTYMKQWIEGMSPADKEFILKGLERDSVRAGKNKRKGSKEEQVGHGQNGQYQSFLPPPSELLGKIGQQANASIPGFSQATSYFQSTQGVGRDMPSPSYAPPPGPPRDFNTREFAPPPGPPSGYSSPPIRPPSPSRYGGSPTSYGPPQPQHHQHGHHEHHERRDYRGESLSYYDTNTNTSYAPPGMPPPGAPPSAMPDASSYGGYGAPPSGPPAPGGFPDAQNYGGYNPQYYGGGQQGGKPWY